MSILVLGKKILRKYDIAQPGIRLFIGRSRVCKLQDNVIENKHVQKYIQFINSDRFKPYITNSSGTVIVRKASENDVI
ncbi:hypothetical protein [Acinetobacter sp. AS167]|uniref:hypothetical protein n=1 Tax=Acinetobacter sp. AS167 TaxID=3127884 RepID=UPI0030178F87